MTCLRNWRKINTEGIERGVFYLDFEWTQNWDKELVEMNEGKVGAPYQFPHSLIRWQAFIAQFFNYRACQGITQQVRLFVQIPNYNHYTTIWRRVKVFDEPLPKPPKGKNISAATEGSGVKDNMAGEYFEDRYGDGRKKYIKSQNFPPVYDWWRKASHCHSGGKFWESKGADQSPQASMPPVFDRWWSAPF